jgi:WD40 repeat protein
MAETQMYDAFMSYSHVGDAELAPTLQRLIRRVGRRWYRRGVLNIFRDRTSLTMTEALWDGIRAAMDQSRFFILMASQAAARSPWVQRELAYWLGTHDPATVLIVLTDGEIVWDDAVPDFDWSATTALARTLAEPPGCIDWPVRSLERRFPSEPLWEDVRSVRTVRRDQDNLRIRDAARTLAASLYGITKDQLDSDDERESRRARRFRRFTFVGLSALTVLALVAAVIAYFQRNEARDQLRIATARSVAAESANLAGRDPVLAARLALLADALAPSAQTQAALMAAIEHNRHIVAYLEQAGKPPADNGDTRITGLQLSPDGTVLAAASSQAGTVRLYDMRSRAMLGELRSPHGGSGEVAPSIVFLPGGRLAVLAALSADIWDLPSRTLLRSIPTFKGVPLAISPDGRWLAVTEEAGAGGVVDVTDPTAPLRPTTSTTAAVLAVTGQRPIADVVPALQYAVRDLSADGARAAVLVDHSRVEMWDLRTGSRLASRALPGDPGWVSVTLAPDASTVLVGNDKGDVVRLDGQLMTAEALGGLPVGVRYLAAGPNGLVGAAVDQSGNLALLSPKSDQRITALPRAPAATAPTLVGAGPWVAVLDNGAAEIWDTRSTTLLTTVRSPSVVFSADHRRFTTVEDGRVVTRALPDLAEVAAVATADPLTVVQATAEGLGNAQLALLPGSDGTQLWAVGTKSRRMLETYPKETGAELLATPTGAVVYRVTENPTPAGTPGARELVTYDLRGSDPVEVGRITRPGISWYRAVADGGARLVLDSSIVDMATGVETPLTGGDGFYSDITSVVTADGTVVRHTTPTRDATSDIRNTLLVWNAAAGQLIGQWPEPMAAQYLGQQDTQLVDIGDGRVATVRPDGTVALWSVGPSAWVRELCALAGEPSDAEKATYLGSVPPPRVCG